MCTDGRRVHSAMLALIVKRLAFMVLAIFVIGCSSDESVSSNISLYDLSGHVYFIGTSQPIVAAVVTCGGRSYTTVRDGYFEFLKLESGSHEIEVSRDEFLPFRMTVDLVSDSAYDVNLTPVRQAAVSGTIFHRLDGPIVECEVCLEMICDTTDEAGRYALSPVPLGRQQISIDCHRYMPIVIDTSIDASMEIDTFLMRTVLDTLPASKQASVGWKCPVDEWGDCRSEIVEQRRSILLVEWLQGDYGGTVKEVWRAFLGLPPLDEVHPDSISFAELHLTAIWSLGEGTGLAPMEIGPVLEDWSESTVTWSSRPLVGDANRSLYCPDTYDEPQELTVEILSVYRDARPERGICFIAMTEGSPHVFYQKTQFTGTPFVCLEYSY